MMTNSKSTDKLYLLTDVVKKIPKETLEDILKNRNVTVKIRWVQMSGVVVPDVILEIKDN